MRDRANIEGSLLRIQILWDWTSGDWTIEQLLVEKNLLDCSGPSLLKLDWLGSLEGTDYQD